MDSAWGVHAVNQICPYLSAMQVNDLVTIDPSIMEDLSTKSNHHLFKRLIAQKEVGTVRELDTEKSEELNATLYWVQFYMAAILIDEKYLVRSEES